MKHIMQLARQFFDVTSRKVGRYFLHLRMRNASEREVLAAERKMRGVEQLDKLQRADIVVVSFGKSGRTWLRVMISHLFRVKHDLPENALLAFDNFHNLNRDIPKIFFTHDNYIKDLTGDHDTKQAFYGKRVVFLARDPRDVAVSQFFQWKFRMNAHKSAINNYPLQDSDTSIFDFVTGDGGGGVSAIAEYMNWSN